MTHTLRQTEDFIDSCITSMKSSINCTKKLTDYSKEWKIHHALNSVDREYNRGVGALEFAHTYLEEIEEDDFDRLNDRLFAEYKKANERVFLEIKD